jgi:predicted  nucleic acid-binding Zn-ribbon protein
MKGASLTMSFFARLLEIQTLDLAVDAARKRVEDLPERKLLPKLAGKRTRVDGEVAEARAEGIRIESAAEEVGRAVAQIVLDIEAAEVERYSGKRKDRDEAVAHDASQQALREKQTELEEEEMSLLESMEAVEGKIEIGLSEFAKIQAEGELVTKSLLKGEAEAASEIAGLEASRGALAEGISSEVMSTYERLRAQPRSGGRGATAFEGGSCTNCRITLPSLERSRMLAEPEDALIQCPQCRKVLVR